jgi:small subunit ribosomal protein S8
MSCTDPIADMLTVIRNGVIAAKDAVAFPHSNIKAGICQVLQEEGFIARFDVLDTKPGRTIRVQLKYSSDGEQVIHEIRRVSSPGRRLYRPHAELKPIIRGYGISILSTSKGVLSDRACREAKVGGEVICIVK